MKYFISCMNHSEDDITPLWINLLKLKASLKGFEKIKNKVCMSLMVEDKRKDILKMLWNIE